MKKRATKKKAPAKRRYGVGLTEVLAPARVSKAQKKALQEAASSRGEDLGPWMVNLALREIGREDLIEEGE